jgi:ferredoxin/flavodoxin---NADP+ reductase
LSPSDIGVEKNRKAVPGNTGAAFSFLSCRRILTIGSIHLTLAVRAARVHAMTMTAEEITQVRRQRYNATVERLVKLHPELMIIRVRPDFVKPKHEPGQYTTLGLGNWEPRHPGSQLETLKPGDEAKLVRRAYSISCSILDDNGALLDAEAAPWVEFYVVLVRDSGDPENPPSLTPRLFMLREGERLQLGEKFTGHFTLEGVKPTDNVLFLSTGTGEAPHNYMLWKLLRDGHPGRILAACCVRFKADLAYASIHDTLVKRHPNYTYIGLTTREALAGQKVYIQDLISSGELENRLGAKLDPANTHVFLCGNPKMIGIPEKDAATGQRVYPRPAGVIELLEAKGFRCDDRVRGNIHFEKYW